MDSPVRCCAAARNPVYVAQLRDLPKGRAAGLAAPG